MLVLRQAGHPPNGVPNLVRRGWWWLNEVRLRALRSYRDENAWLAFSAGSVVEQQHMTKGAAAIGSPRERCGEPSQARALHEGRAVGSKLAR